MAIIPHIIIHIAKFHTPELDLACNLWFVFTQTRSVSFHTAFSLSRSLFCKINFRQEKLTKNWLKNRLRRHSMDSRKWWNIARKRGSFINTDSINMSAISISRLQVKPVFVSCSYEGKGLLLSYEQPVLYRCRHVAFGKFFGDDDLRPCGTSCDYCRNPKVREHCDITVFKPWK